MASVITATTTSGLTQSADNSGVLQLASGTGNLVTVPAVTGTAMVSGNMPAFSAYLTTTPYNVTTATFTKIPFDAELFDTANAFDSTTNYRFTPQVNGYYQVNAGLYFSGSAAVTRGIIAFYKNGASYILGNMMSPYTSTNNGVAVISALIYCNGSTDYIEVYGRVDGTSPFFNGDAGGTQVYFSGSMVRGA
jgi:hypothetical protein